MKKGLYTISIFVAIFYCVAFCTNVQELVTRHMDYEVFLPFEFMVFSVLLLLALLITRHFKPFDKKLLIIPVLFFAVL